MCSSDLKVDITNDETSAKNLFVKVAQSLALSGPNGSIDSLGFSLSTAPQNTAPGGTASFSGSGALPTTGPATYVDALASYLSPTVNFNWFGSSEAIAKGAINLTAKTSGQMEGFISVCYDYTAKSSVPDAGSTIAMLTAALTGIGVLRRRV